MTPVLWVTQVYPRQADDVMGSFLHRLARELPPRGIPVRVLAPGADGVPERESRDDVDIVRFPYAGPGQQNLAYTGEMHRRAMRHPFRFVRFLTALRSAVGAELRRPLSPGLVHAHWWAPSGWAALPAARAGVPLVVSVHGTDMRLIDRIPLAPLAARRVLGRANRVLAVSSFLARRLDALGVGASAILPMPADTDVFRIESTGASLPEPPRFVVAARLTAQKRVDRVVSAVSVLAKRGRVVALDVAGDGPERSRLETLAHESGLADQVRFHGMVPAADLAGLYRRATACILSSDQEGYGLTVVEAALCGTPSIGVRSGGLLDVIDPGVTGALVEPDDVGALADAMARLVADRKERDRQGEAARRQATSLTPGALADRLVAIYEQTLRA